LIYDKINHEALWYQYLKNIDRDKYNIYIHYKHDIPLLYFNKYKLLTTIPTQYGGISIVMAQLLLLQEALKDKDNQHFIWLSQACVPLKSFDTIYNSLDETKSYFNLAPDTQVFPRANLCLKYIRDRKRVKKANMASIVNRKHAIFFLTNHSRIRKIFSGIKHVDEIALITVLHCMNLQHEIISTHNIAAGAIIFAQWSDIDNYKVFQKSIKKNDYTYMSICQEELDYLVKSNSLFGRKFEEGCRGLENLLDMF